MADDKILTKKEIKKLVTSLKRSASELDGLVAQINTALVQKEIVHLKDKTADKLRVAGKRFLDLLGEKGF